MPLYIWAAEWGNGLVISSNCCLPRCSGIQGLKVRLSRGKKKKKFRLTERVEYLLRVLSEKIKMIKPHKIITKIWPLNS